MSAPAAGTNNRWSASTAEPETVDDEYWMSLALDEARIAAAQGDVPVGAIIVRGEEVLAKGHNRRELDGDPLAHAEIIALRNAARSIEGWRLVGCRMYVTLEPCAMCAGALVNSRIESLVFGARDPKAGYCGSLGDLTRDPRLNHRLKVEEGVLAESCGQILKDFFRALRRR